MLTTSQRIALRFALTIAGIVLFFGIVINIAFFGSRRKREQHFLTQQFGNQVDLIQTQNTQRKFARKKGGGLGPRNMLLVSINNEEHLELMQQTIFANLTRFDNERYIYGPTRNGDQLLVIDISPIIHNQIALLRITLISLLISSGVGYALSIWSVKKGLRDLQILTEKVKQINIDSLHTPFSFPHLPAHDEIQIVSRALDDMTTNIHNQVNTIKQFVAHVSHEFKTPLMSLQSTIDVGEKTKQYEIVMTHAREEIGIMDRLLDTLLILTQTHKKPFLEKSNHNLEALLVPLLREMQEKYPQIHFVYTGDPLITLTTHQGSFERIVSNLIDNAAKFTTSGGKVTIEAQQSSLTITDTGLGITPEQLDAIREPFWQGDAARGTEGFGLGLSLVKQLVTLLEGKIGVKSKVGTGTTVTITW